jgi:hypothetical protein
MATKPRSIRVSDEIWNRSKKAARAAGTSVTVMIIDYLKSIDTETTVVETDATKAKVRSTHPRNKHAPGHVLLDDPATCTHPERKLKRLPYGVFCRCGTRIS